MSSVDVEARRRVDRAGDLIASAMRLGVDPEYVAVVVRTGVALGAEQHAEDAKEAFDHACAVPAGLAVGRRAPA